MFRPVVNNHWTHQFRHYRKTFGAKGGTSEGRSPPSAKEQLRCLVPGGPDINGQIFGPLTFKALDVPAS